MIRSLLSKILFIALVSFTSVASADYDKQCKISFQSYFSPSISGFSLSMNKSGQFSFKKSGRVVKKQKFVNEFNSEEEFDQFIELFTPVRIMKVTLVIREQGNFLRGKMTLDSSINDNFDFPPLEFQKIKNDFREEAALDNGLLMKLKVTKTATLSLAGDFGQINFSGPCKKYSTSSSVELPSSNLDKLKSTCTELGFKFGTEKHGDCVLKLMDK